MAASFRKTSRLELTKTVTSTIVAFCGQRLLAGLQLGNLLRGCFQCSFLDGQPKLLAKFQRFGVRRSGSLAFGRDGQARRSARLCQDGGLVGCALAEFSLHRFRQVQALRSEVTQLARDASQGRVAGGHLALLGRVLQWHRRGRAQ